VKRLGRLEAALRCSHFRLGVLGDGVKRLGRLEAALRCSHFRLGVLGEGVKRLSWRAVKQAMAERSFQTLSKLQWRRRRRNQRLFLWRAVVQVMAERSIQTFGKNVWLQ